LPLSLPTVGVIPHSMRFTPFSEAVAHSQISRIPQLGNTRNDKKKVSFRTKMIPHRRESLREKSYLQHFNCNSPLVRVKLQQESTRLTRNGSRIKCGMTVSIRVLFLIPSFRMTPNFRRKRNLILQLGISLPISRDRDDSQVTSFRTLSPKRKRRNLIPGTSKKLIYLYP
jgi:hypothetical protein